MAPIYVESYTITTKPSVAEAEPAPVIPIIFVSVGSAYPPPPPPAPPFSGLAEPPPPP